MPAKWVIWVYSVVVRVLKSSCISLYTAVFRALTPSYQAKIPTFLLMVMLLLSSCNLIKWRDGVLQIRAVIEGDIKGHRIYCEKTINLSDKHFGVMCHLDGNMDIKYRIHHLKEQKQIDFVVDKPKNYGHKVLATSSLIIPKLSPAKTIANNHYGTIMALVERLP